MSPVTAIAAAAVAAESKAKAAAPVPLLSYGAAGADGEVTLAVRKAQWAVGEMVAAAAAIADKRALDGGSGAAGGAAADPMGIVVRFDEFRAHHTGAEGWHIHVRCSRLFMRRSPCARPSPPHRTAPRATADPIVFVALVRARARQCPRCCCVVLRSL
jgi:hypothetical protein